jgi:hypothetical protein
MRRSYGQVRLIGAELGAGCPGAGSAAQLPETLEVTLGGLPGPCETVSVVRVHVELPLLYDTIVVLVTPAGALPKDAT